MYLAFKIYASDLNKPEGMPDAWPRGQIVDLGNNPSAPDNSGEWLIMTKSEFDGYKAFHRPAYNAYAQALKQEQLLEEQIKETISERRYWAESMMERFKKRNIESGLNLAQSLHMHQRLRSLDVTITQEMADQFSDLNSLVNQTLTIDLLNLVITGDLETAYVVLLGTNIDDGSQPYHSLDADAKNWLLNEIGSYLNWV